MEARFIFGMLILLYASYFDFKYRKIDDKSWTSLILLGLAFFAYERSDPIFFILSIGTTSGIAFLLYRTGILGDGDAKIWIGISFLMPSCGGIFPFFSLSVFVNAVLICAFLPVIFFVHNLKEIGNVRSRKDFLILFLGYKKNGAKIKKFEAIIKKDGEYRLFLNARKVKLGEKSEGEVWVSPAIPFLIPLTLGFMISFHIGYFYAPCT